MSKWIMLTTAGARADPVAVNLDQATSMLQMEHKTRLVFGQADTIEVAERVSDILDKLESTNLHRS